jgi:hypothetical protein
LRFAGGSRRRCRSARSGRIAKLATSSSESHDPTLPVRVAEPKAMPRLCSLPPRCVCMRALDAAINADLAVRSAARRATVLRGTPHSRSHNATRSSRSRR